MIKKNTFVNWQNKTVKVIAAVIVDCYLPIWVRSYNSEKLLGFQILGTGWLLSVVPSDRASSWNIRHIQVKSWNSCRNENESRRCFRPTRSVNKSCATPHTHNHTYNHETSIVTGTILANVIIGARLSGALLFGCPSLTSTWAEVDVQTSKARANWVAMGSFASSTPLRLGEAGVGQLVNIVHIVGTRCWSFRVSPLPSTRRGFLDNGQSSALLKQLLSPAIRFLLYFIHIHTNPYSQISYSGYVSIAYLDLIGLNYSRGLNGREWLIL